jgi:hypothetical protein
MLELSESHVVERIELLLEVELRAYGLGESLCCHEGNDSGSQLRLLRLR